MFVVLPSIRPRNFATVIECAQDLPPYNKPNILWQEIRSENEVLALKGNYWRLSVRRSTTNPVKQPCYCYRARSGFTFLKPTPTCNSRQEIRIFATFLMGDLVTSTPQLVSLINDLNTWTPTQLAKERHWVYVTHKNQVRMFSIRVVLETNGFPTSTTEYCVETDGFQLVK